MSTTSPPSSDSTETSGSAPHAHALPLGRAVIDAITVAYHADLPVLLWGERGVGKSEIFAQAARQLGVAFIWRDLSLLEPPDLLGLPRVSEAPGRANEYQTSYAPPSFLPRADTGTDAGAGKGGILLLEELNRSPHSILGPALQLILERQLGEYRLPAGWLPVAAANPGGGTYHVSSLDPALVSRFQEITCVPDVGAWVAWALANGVHHTVVDLVRRTPDAFADPHANPRAWTMASRILHACDLHPTSGGARLASLRGVLKGDRWAAALASEYRQRDRPLEPIEIVDGYDGWRSAVRGWAKEGRTDLLRATLELLLRHLDPLPDYQLLLADEVRKARVERFIADLPADLRAQIRVWLEERGFRHLRVRVRAPRVAPP